GRSSLWDGGRPPPLAIYPGTARATPSSPYAILQREELARFTPLSRVRHCGAGPRLTADGCYPLPCPALSGLSSSAFTAATVWPARTASLSLREFEIHGLRQAE